MEAKDFDRKFENGDDIIEYLDLDKVLRPRQEQKRVNVDFPVWMIQQLDKEARKLGVTRQSIIKIWLAERLKESTI
ncbi:MAG: CopG family transcriptional regulator [Calditrichia bacterium]|nr:CopG family transcriptional regulator [Calditrichia bacterium]